jgi:dephospho-CoA kinase
MLKIGLTGGIGSGKSVVCKIFSALGIPVFSSDEVSRSLIKRDPEIIKTVTRVFGRDIYRNGILDRKKLSECVFTDKDSLEKLNSIMHPAVAKAFNEWLKSFDNQSYIIKEAAIIFESGTDKELDFVVTVSAPESLRISRVMERDGISKEEVLLRMRNQVNEKERLSLSDEIIHNDDQRLVIPQVLEMHKRFKEMSG